MNEISTVRQEFDFPITPLQRLPGGTQKIILQCPTIRGRAFTGLLTVRWNPKYSTVQWDFGSIDGYAYPQCDIFKDCLEETNWDQELVRRLINAGWNLEESHRLDMRWELLREVEHEIAQWIIDTLPGVYKRACLRFEEVHVEREEKFFNPD